MFLKIHKTFKIHCSNYLITRNVLFSEKMKFSDILLKKNLHFIL